MINLEPIIKNYEDGHFKVILSNDFQKIYDAEVDRIETIMNYYFEDPNHCKVFTFKDVYQFEKELSDLLDTFMFEQATQSLIENIKIRVIDLCNRFINGEMIAKSTDYYKVWDNFKYNYNC